jgi:hypothetical protein
MDPVFIVRDERADPSPENLCPFVVVDTRTGVEVERYLFRMAADADCMRRNDSSKSPDPA